MTGFLLFRFIQSLSKSVPFCIFTKEDDIYYRSLSNSCSVFHTQILQYLKGYETLGNWFIEDWKYFPTEGKGLYLMLSILK